MRTLSEDQEQILIVEWARLVPVGKYKLADFLHHSPNGGLRNAREGAKFKRMGVLSGFPDLFLFVPRNGLCGLFIELKAKKGIVSQNQKIVLGRLEDQGYKTVVCYGFEHAKRTIEEYLA